MQFDIVGALLALLVFIPAVTLHEYCHAKFADMAGDMTPRSQKRVTLNPLSHLDPIGTIMVVLSHATGMGLGWGRPVLVNVGKLKNPRWDHFILVVAGPLSNLAQAIVFALIIRSGLVTINIEALLQPKLAIQSSSAFFSFFVLSSLFMNVGMFFFNLIPLGPLDGHWLVGALLPVRQREAWYKFCHGPGMILFLVLVLLPRGGFNPLNWYSQHVIFPTIFFMLGIPNG
jgi:Zn-dependent protease